MDKNRSPRPVPGLLPGVSILIAVFAPASHAAGAAGSSGRFQAWQAYCAAGLELLLVVSAVLLVCLMVVLRQRNRLTEHDQRLSGIINSSHAGTWEWHVQTGEARFSERWAEMIGYRLEDLQPVTIHTWTDRIHPDDLTDHNAQLQRHFVGETGHFETETRVRHREGHWVWILESGRVVTRTEDGQPEWMSGVSLDVTDRRVAQDQREDSFNRLESLCDNVPGVIFQLRRRPDGTMHFPFASKGLNALFGCHAGDVAADASPVLDRLHPNDREALEQVLDHSAKAHEPWQQVFRVDHLTLGLRWLEGHATPSNQRDGSVLWNGQIRDFTDMHGAHERVRTAASVFDASQDAIVISDADFSFRDVNRAFVELTGYTLDDIQGDKPEKLLPMKNHKRVAAGMRSALRKDGRWNGEVLILNRSGETVPVELSISGVRDEDGRLSHYVTLMGDITVRKTQEEQLGKIANHDPLTGVGNRRMADMRLQRLSSLARSSGARFAVCMMDLDNFKPINDSYGHDAGDHVLTTVAERVQELIRSKDCLCRLGGDEFLLILSEPQGERVFERILESVRIPILVEGQIARVSASMGIALCDAGSDQDSDDLLRRADRAVYAAKAAGRNCFRFDDDQAPQPPSPSLDQLRM